MRRIFFAHILTLAAVAGWPFARPLIRAQPTSDQAYASQITGTWQFSFPDGLENARIEMRADGRWSVWSPPPEPSEDPRRAIQGGSWFVRDGILFLRIERVEFGHMPAGLAYTFDFVSVSPDIALFTWLDGNRQVKWTRVSQVSKPFWRVAVSYQPPFKMRSFLYPTNAGAFPGDWELDSGGVEAGTNGRAQVVFHLGTVAEFVGPDVPATRIKTAADLKDFLDSKLRADPRGTNTLTSYTEIDTRQALMSLTLTNTLSSDCRKWSCSVCFFWEKEPASFEAALCSITLSGERHESLPLLTNSLRTLRLYPGEQKR